MMWRAVRCAAPVLGVATLVGVVVTGCGSSERPAEGSPAQAAEITVAAASDLRPAFIELGAMFTAETGTKVTFSFGSSGQLREQILNGAPFDLFASANAEFVDEVVAAGRGQGDTQADYALGRIVLWSASGEPPTSVAELADSRYRRIAIANPRHAPYGLAAQQALESAGIFETVQPRLVYGESVSDTFQIAKSGNVDAAIVALSLAIADGSAYALIPAEMHEPLRQALVVTSTGARGEAARAFAQLLASRSGRNVMVRYGFVLPGETVPEENWP